MKAIVFDDFGGADQLKLREVQDPRPGAGDILIRVRAAGVNPVDAKIRMGLLKTRLPHQFPVIPGWDASGVVEGIGAGVTLFRPGEEVYAYCRKPVIQWGAYAEYICVPADSAALKPETLSHEEAACIPLAALTAYQSLFDAGMLIKGQTVLIHAAAGGVGSYAVQLAKLAGARVIGTVSPPKQAFAKTLGADDLIDYTAGDFRAALKSICPDGVDLVFDTVGGAVQSASADVIKKGGTLVSILAYSDKAALERRGIRCEYVFVAPHAAQLRELKNLADTRSLKVFVSEVFPMAEAARAHERIESGHTQGKIVLKGF